MFAVCRNWANIFVHSIVNEGKTSGSWQHDLLATVREAVAASQTAVDVPDPVPAGAVLSSAPGPGPAVAHGAPGDVRSVLAAVSAMQSTMFTKLDQVR